MSLTKVTYSMIQGASANILDFGASSANSAADNAAAINAAIQAADSVYIPSGTYVSNTITLRSGVSLYGDGASSVLSFANGQTGFYGLSSGAGAYLENNTISNLKLLGAVAASGFSEFVHLINVNGVRNFSVENCQLVGFQGDGLYLGANADNTRHNINVSVTNCLFDGVNKDNRNGISVIDCDGLKVRGCTFTRMSRSNMPGQIDVEPNSVDNIVKNISITHNIFEDTNAAEGVFVVAITSKTLTVDPVNFDFSHNIVNVNKIMVTFFVDGVYTKKHNLNIVGNTGSCLAFANIYPRWIGGSFSNNALQVTSQANIGFAAGNVMQDIAITGNSLDGSGSANRLFSIRDGSNIVVSGNTFKNCTTYGFLCGISGGNLSNVSITGNVFLSCGNLVVGSSGGIDGKTCTFLNNTHNTTHQFPAWRTDDTGNINNGDTSPTTFNADNLPSAFDREVVYMSAINGDTAVPNTGGYQGVLRTFCEAGENGRKWKYQTYWPSNNTVKINSFYLRKAANATDTWETWAEVAGV